MQQTPDVSILIANRDGRGHLEQCLPSIRNQTYPKNHTEVLLLDDASTDDSISWTKKHYPEVRIVANKINLGFAPVNNVGVREAKGTLVALLNNDTRAEPDWLEKLVSGYLAQPGAKAAGSKMLSWDGADTTFYGGNVNFVGKGFELWCRKDAPEDPREPYDMLFPCAGAAIYDRQTWIETGGFDDAYGMTYEDVDIGWRFNLFGHRCVYIPDSVVYHRARGWLSSIDYGRRAPFLERNALATIFKNYGDEAFRRIFPAALLLSIKRSRILGWHAEHDWGAYSWFDEMFGKTEDLDQFHGDGLHHLAALDKFVDGMPELWRKRKDIQSRRVVGDDVILKKFFPEPFKVWALHDEHLQRLERGGYFEMVERLVDLWGIRELF